MAISFAAVSSLIYLFDFLPTFLGGSEERLASFSLFLVRIHSIVGGGEDGGSEGEGMTARAVAWGEGGGDRGSSTGRDSKGLEDEGKDWAELEGGGGGAARESEGGLEFGPCKGIDFFFFTCSQEPS